MGQKCNLSAKAPVHSMLEEYSSLPLELSEITNGWLMTIIDDHWLHIGGIDYLLISYWSPIDYSLITHQ